MSEEWKRKMQQRRKICRCNICDTICIYGIDGKEIKFNYVDEEISEA